MTLTSFWSSDEWLAYERAYGDAAGTRAALLAGADWTTRVLDLAADEATLWRGIRKSYHSLINGLRKDPRFAVAACDQTTFFRQCRWLHLREAGRETRPIATWIEQAKWIESGRARAYLASLDGEPVGFAYVAIARPWAYYYSAASLVPNVQHAIQWYAITDLKRDGVRWYELGWQGQASDEKGRAIEFFRRGFGGVDRRFTEELG